MVPGSILENKIIIILSRSLHTYKKNNNNNMVGKVVFSPEVDCVWLMCFSHAIELIKILLLM